MTTLGLVLFIIACLLSAIASGIAFYFDDKKKKEQKEKLKILEKRINFIYDKLYTIQNKGEDNNDNGRNS